MLIILINDYIKLCIMDSTRSKYVSCVYPILYKYAIWGMFRTYLLINKKKTLFITTNTSGVYLVNYI